MKTSLLITLTGILAVNLFAAEPGLKDKIAKAGKELADKPNYSWLTSTKEADGSPGRLSNIEGQADKAAGLIHLTFAVGGIPVEVFLKGTNGAAKALEGWMTLEEISQTSGTAAAVVRYLRSYKPPTIQIAELMRNLSDIKEEDGVLTGDLKEEGMKEILLLGARQRDGQAAPKISEAKGTVRFFMSGGSLTKYEIKAQGKVTAGERTMDIDRIVTVQIKDVGTTKLEVPAEAQQKMS